MESKFVVLICNRCKGDMINIDQSFEKDANGNTVYNAKINCASGMCGDISVDEVTLQLTKFKLVTRDFFTPIEKLN